MKKTLSNISLIILLCFSLISNAQELANNTRSSVHELNGEGAEQSSIKKRAAMPKRNFISIHIGSFDPWLGVHYERIITPYWGFDVALSLIGASVGTKLYFPRLSKGKASVYTGISEGVLVGEGPKHYIPIGVTYIGKRDFRLSLDAGPQIYHDTNEEYQLGFSFKIGKSF